MPLKLTSIPAGAEVFARLNTAGKTSLDAIGRTPLTLRYRPGQALALHLRRAGCSESVLDLSTVQTWQHTVRMHWAPIDQFSYDNTPVHGALYAAGGMVVFSSRDGALHALDPIGRVVKWRRRIGRFGDPVSPLLIHDGTLTFGTVDGRILCLSAAGGDVLWQAEVPGAACFAPVRTPEGDILAATGAGYLVRLREGKIAAQARVEGACTSGPALANAIAAVASTPDTCTAFHAGTLAPRWRRVFDAGIVAGPYAFGGSLVLVTRQNIVHALCPEKGEQRWQTALPAPPSAAPYVSATHVTLALETGEILQIRENGETAHRGRAGEAPLGAPLALGKRLAAGSDNGAFMLFDVENARVAWTYESPAPIAARPCLFQGKLIFATVRGDFAVMEVLP